ncbi:MAG: CFI-box-CTERM domain-containing protein, partial [Vulcanimicrobiota bacterium]
VIEAIRKDEPGNKFQKNFIAINFLGVGKDLVKRAQMIFALEVFEFCKELVEDDSQLKEKVETFIINTRMQIELEKFRKDEGVADTFKVYFVALVESKYNKTGFNQKGQRKIMEKALFALPADEILRNFEYIKDNYPVIASLENLYLEELKNKTIEIKEKGMKEKKCFIATATFEDTDHPVVEKLRNFRDRKLNKTMPGRLFVGFYYLVGPPLARFMKKNIWAGKISRPVLTWLSNLL